MNECVEPPLFKWSSVFFGEELFINELKLALKTIELAKTLEKDGCYVRGYGFRQFKMLERKNFKVEYCLVEAILTITDNGYSKTEIIQEPAIYVSFDKNFKVLTTDDEPHKIIYKTMNSTEFSKGFNLFEEVNRSLV